MITPLSTPVKPLPLGRFDVKWYDGEDGVTYTIQETMRATSQVGNPAGYASVNDALAAGARVSLGEAGSAAVIKRDGRFDLFRVEELGYKNAWVPANFEVDPIDGSHALGIRSLDKPTDLRAIVDGDFTHRFRSF